VGSAVGGPTWGEYVTTPEPLNYNNNHSTITMTTQGKPHVLIVDASLGGLVLAQALRKQGVSFTVFERSLDTRFQGWVIGLHRYAS
jgi:NADPH-dependent 2,4-dienoyl-CoA reductase/sulfur reductase-like enzyme